MDDKKSTEQGNGGFPGSRITSSTSGASRVDLAGSSQSFQETTAEEFGGTPIGLTGVVIRKVVPSDNSCLFTAVTFCITGTEWTTSEELREIIATTVLQDPVKYNEGFLGRSNLEYVEWISRFDSWGGGIELAILSEFYSIEINVLDTQYMRINRFGEDREHNSRIFLVYDGIHYDALYLECYDGSKIVTMFPTADTSVYDQVMELGRMANSTHQFTDVKNFTLRCENCDSQFQGPEEATAHAKQTGHTSFAECK